MAHTLLVDTIIDSFPSPSFPGHTGKPDYASIVETHSLLTKNVVSTNIPHGGVQNGHLGLVLTATQYEIVIPFPFVRPTDPGQTPTIPDWGSPFNKKIFSGNTRNTVINTTSV